MTDTANKARNRRIARNEEARQITGSVRVSVWAVSAAIAIGIFLFTIGWIAVRR
jgi:hypothetical protein